MSEPAPASARSKIATPWLLGLILLDGLAGQEETFRPDADLPPLLEFLDGTRVSDADDFERRREEVRELLRQHFVGSAPATPPALEQAELLDETIDEAGNRRRRIRLTWATPNHRSFEIRLWLPPGDGPRPLLLTQPRGYQLPWAQLALTRGYAVALYPGIDSHHREPGFPDYHDIWQTFRSEYPEADWSELRTKAWLASRTLDYVLDAASGAGIVARQVGIIGFSRYGKQSLIAAAFDPRITAVVARSPGSPGSSPYRFTSRDTCAETPADFPGEWFLPGLRSFAGREHELPIDAHGWYALIAPRRCLIHTAHNDGSEPTFAVERAYLEGREVYRLLGAPEHLRIRYRTGQHGPITDEHRKDNLDWFDLSFGRGEAREDWFPEELLHAFDWHAWRARQPPDGVEPRPRRATSDPERRAAIRWMLGRTPATVEPASSKDFLTPTESQMMTHDRWALPGVRRVPITFGAGVRGNAYFRQDLSGPAPVVVWLHPLSYHSGYNEGYGVEDTTVYHRLADAGCVVLAYDQCGFGLRLLEGTDFYARNPGWSRFGRMVHDARAAVDFAVNGAGRAAADVPAMRGDRVILLGYSVGGLVALHAAALDSRVHAVACWSGCTPLRSDTDDSPTGGLRRLWETHALLPKLGLFHGRETDVPYDVDDLLRLLGERPALLGAAQRDRTVDPEAVRTAVESARRGRPGARLTLLTPDATLGFQRSEQQRMLDWLRAEALRP